jgi:hypothetical protein
VSDENQFSVKKYLNVTSFLSSLITGFAVVPESDIPNFPWPFVPGLRSVAP